MAIAKTSSTTARRREVRRSMPRPRYRWLDGLMRREVAWAAFHVVVITIVGSLVVWLGQSWPMYRKGQQVLEPIYSRVKFEAIDEKATEEKMDIEGEVVPAIYTADEGYLKQLREKLIGLEINAESVPELQGFVANGKPTDTWIQRVDQFLAALAGLSVLSEQDFARETDETQRASRITVKHSGLDNGEESRWDHQLISVDDMTELGNRLASVAKSFPASLRQRVVDLIMGPEVKPLYRLDHDETQIRKQAARNEAAKKPELLIQLENQLIVEPGETLEARHLVLLDEEQKTYRQTIGPFRNVLNRVAGVGLIALIALGLWVYILGYKPLIVHNVMRGIVLTALVLLGQLLAVLFFHLNPEHVMAMATGTLPTLLVTVVLIIVYDQRFALAVGALHTIFVTATLSLPVEFALVLLVGVVVAVLQLSDVRTRSKLVWVGLWTGVAMAIAVWIVRLALAPLHVEGVIWYILVNSFWAFVFGLATGLLALGMLPAIEKIFNVTTSMTLKELNDASHPLLRQLAGKAPGTYQHSLRLADITEAAAEAIGANALLCKVGATYHDIGKMNKPLYFVENQAGGPNRHEKLSPTMSVLIIVGHVKDGIEMAREFRLPPVLRHFIESHHGTTLVEYFYHAAKQKSEENASPVPTEFEFRYPGPKPQTKEAAIMLLGDAIESAARSLADPTPVRLEQMTHQIASKRLLDGQFDECHLTLQELSKIERAIAKTLCAVYHARIKYPEQERKDEAEPERSESQAAPAAAS